jgi:transposase
LKPLNPPQRTSLSPRHWPDESLRRENSRLRRENERLQRVQQEQAEQLAKQEREIADQKKELADKNGEIVDLERQLAIRKQNSTNSSKPPSSDGLAGESRERGGKKSKSRRKPGGQPGHHGHHRGRVPLEQVDETRAVLASQCRHCEQPLAQRLERVQTSGRMYRHQVVELPVIKARVTEYQFHEVVCPQCGKKSRAAVPPELQRQTGPQLTALVAYLTVVCRTPRRVVQEFLEQALSIDLSLGNTQTCWEEASEAVAAPCQELEQKLNGEAVLNIDETGWRTNGEKRYLWAFVAAQYVVYSIAQTRGSALLIQTLGAVFEGILCSDRFSGYRKYHQGRAQLCWAHLKRNIRGVLEFTKKSATERFCRDALALHARLFRLWHKFKSGQIDRHQLCTRSIPLQKKFLALAEANLGHADRQVQNLATALFVNADKLFTFLEIDGVEPTNNSAERALRTGVQWRKICFGNRSSTGELATARLLTVSQTCRLQQQNSLHYLSNAISRYRRALPVASLLNR